MEKEELYAELDFPHEVIDKLHTYEKERSVQLSGEETERLLERKTWDEAIRRLKDRLGEDPEGLGLLWEELEIVRTFSLGAYKKRRFPWKSSGIRCGLRAVFWRRRKGRTEDTVLPLAGGFRDRCLFRNTGSVRWSMNGSGKGVPITCLSWMMMPQLSDLLGETSNVVRFMRRFDLVEIFDKETWYKDWIYPGFEGKNEELPEKTRLQRRLKAYLLEGKTFGVALGRLRLQQEGFGEDIEER